MHRRTGRTLAVAALLVAGTTVAASAPASAAPDSGGFAGAGRTPFPFRHTTTPSGEVAAQAAPTAGTYPLRVTTLTKDVVAPLQFTVTPRGAVLVADAVKGTITRIGRKTPLVTAPPGTEIAGIDVDRSGKTIAYTTTAFGPQGEFGKATLTIKRPGRKPIVADLSGFEAKHNPDANVRYGVDNPSECVVEAFKKIGAPVSYTGVNESHPYAVAAVPGGWIVADAAGNDLLKVNSRGKVSLVGVLPRQPVTFTAEQATALGLPECVVGVTYNFEPVPTDVEVGPKGALYVSTLPGGPEDPSLGARGSVYRLAAGSTSFKRVATGFAGATNLAVTRSGKVLVTELFAGRISVAARGAAHPVIDLPNVVAVEFARGRVYASTVAPFGEEGPVGTGSVVRIDVAW